MDGLRVVTITLLFLALLVVVVNWATVILSLRNKRRMIDRHYSTIPFAAQVFGVAGAISSRLDPVGIIPPWACVLVALLDVSLWSLVCLPIHLLRRRGRRG